MGRNWWVGSLQTTMLGTVAHESQRLRFLLFIPEWCWKPGFAGFAWSCILGARRLTVVFTFTAAGRCNLIRTAIHYHRGFPLSTLPEVNNKSATTSDKAEPPPWLIVGKSVKYGNCYAQWVGFLNQIEIERYRWHEEKIIQDPIG